MCVWYHIHLTYKKNMPDFYYLVYLNFQILIFLMFHSGICWRQSGISFGQLTLFHLSTQNTRKDKSRLTRGIPSSHFHPVPMEMISTNPEFFSENSQLCEIIIIHLFLFMNQMENFHLCRFLGIQMICIF